MLLQFGGYRQAFSGQDGCDPVRRPGALAKFVDARQGLKRDGGFDGIGERAPQVVPLTAHCESGCTNRAAEVEDKDQRVGVAAELQSDYGKEDAFARASGANYEGVTDIADVERKSERC